MKEFVVINREGREVEWIDPVEDEDIRETKCYWYVNNGYFTYRFWKYEGYKYVHRTVELEE